MAAVAVPQTAFFVERHGRDGDGARLMLVLLLLLVSLGWK